MKIELFIFALAAVLWAKPSALQAQETPDIWDGSADISWYDATEPTFTLTTPEQLAGLAQLVNEGDDFTGKTVLLGNDIWLSDTIFRTYIWTPIGFNGQQFQGQLDGQGHKIVGLYVNYEENAEKMSKYEEGYGFFGHVGKKGSIHRISLVCANVQGELHSRGYYSRESARAYSGGIAGWSEGLIGYCYMGGYGSVSSSAVGYSSCSFSGGIVGYNEGGINNCSNEYLIISDGGTTTYLGGDCRSGGIAGNNRGQIRDCFNVGSVVSGVSTALKVAIVGGIAGGNEGSISSCYNTGMLTAENNIGGIAGKNEGSIIDCYYLAGGASGSGTAKSSEAFASGEVCWLLQNAASGTVWGQTMDWPTTPDGLNTEKLPVWRTETNQVFRVLLKTGATDTLYVNSGDLELPDLSEPHRPFAWYMRETGGEPVENTLYINSDLILYGRWTAEQCTLSLGCDASMGRVTGGGTYDYGTEVTITATPYAGYKFVKWSDGNPQAQRTFALEQDMELTAEFALVEYILDLSCNSSMGSVSGGGVYAYGTDVIIEATPKDGYKFVRWSDGNTQARRRIMVEKDLFLTAEFALAAYTVTLSCDAGMGSVKGGGQYEEGTEIFIEATPKSGYRFVRWSDGNTLARRLLVVESDVDLTAIFECSTYTVSLLCDPEMGFVSGGGIYDEGEEVTIEAVAKQGYVFVQWSDGGKQAKRTIYVDEDIELEAEFGQLTAVEDLSEADPFQVAARNLTLYISGTEAEATVYTVGSILIYCGYAREIPLPAAGLYIVKIGNSVKKVAAH